MSSLSSQSNQGADDRAPSAPSGAGGVVVVFGLVMAVAAFVAAAFFSAKIAVGIIGLFVVGLATLRSPYFGLLLYILVLYVRPGEIGLVPAGLHFERVVALGLMLVVFVQRGLGYMRPLPANALNRVMLCFWLAVALGIPFAFWKGGAFNGLIDLSKLCLLYLGIIYLADDVRKLRTLMWVVLLAWAWYGFSAVTGYASGTEVYQGEAYVMRAMGPTSRFGDADTLGNLLACALPYIGLLVWHEKGRLRLLMVAIGLLMIAGIVVTGSRTGALALGFVLVLLVLTGRHKLLTGGVLVAAMVVAWLVMPAPLRERYSTIQSYGSEATWVARRDIWEVGKRMFMDHPAFGVGAGNFADARATLYDGVRLAPHSVYVQVAAELGVAGIACFVALVWFVVRENRRLRRTLRRGPPSDEVSYALALSLAAELTLYTLLFVGITGHNLYNPSYYLVAALTVCLSHFAANLKPAEEKPPATAKA